MSNSTPAQAKADPSDQPQQQQKPQVLEEDDEFEDFPVEGTYRQLSPARRETRTDQTMAYRLAPGRSRAAGRLDGQRRERASVGGELG